MLYISAFWLYKCVNRSRSCEGFLGSGWIDLGSAKRTQTQSTRCVRYFAPVNSSSCAKVLGFVWWRYWWLRSGSTGREVNGRAAAQSGLRFTHTTGRFLSRFQLGWKSIFLQVGTGRQSRLFSRIRETVFPWSRGKAQLEPLWLFGVRFSDVSCRISGYSRGMRFTKRDCDTSGS